MNSYMVLLTVSVLAVWLCTRPARLRAAALRESQKAELLNRGLCPTCAGKPFELIQMNGLTGCLDCASSGSARRYLRITGR